MKKVIESVLAKKKYALYALLIVPLSIYEYGIDDTIQIGAIIIAIIAPTLVVLDIYMLVTSPQTKPNTLQIVYIAILSGLVFASYLVIEKSSIPFALYLSIALLIAISSIALFFRSYNKGKV